jgi:hypothetical protein
MIFGTLKHRLILIALKYARKGTPNEAFFTISQSAAIIDDTNC